MKFRITYPANIYDLYKHESTEEEIDVDDELEAVYYMLEELGLLNHIAVEEIE